MERRVRAPVSAALGWLARCLSAAAVAGTLASFAGTVWWLGEVAASLRPVFAAVLVVSTLAAWWRARIGWAAGFGLLSLTFPLLQWPGHRVLEPAPKAPPAKALSIFCHNLWGANRQAMAELEDIRKLSPDIAVLVEVDSWWAKQLESLESAYPYNLVEARDGYFGVAVFSRIPLRKSLLRDFSGYEIPSPLIEFEFQGQVVTLIATHPPPPVDAQSFRIRNWQLAELAREARLCEHPLIVVGDFNCTPWSATLHRFLRESGLRKSSVSQEITWSPLRSSWLGFPIDYQLATQEWREEHGQTGNFLGSDHRWTFTRLQLGSDFRR